MSLYFIPCENWKDAFRLLSHFGTSTHKKYGQKKEDIWVCTQFSHNAIQMEMEELLTVGAICFLVYSTGAIYSTIVKPELVIQLISICSHWPGKYKSQYSKILYNNIQQYHLHSTYIFLFFLYLGCELGSEWHLKVHVCNIFLLIWDAKV